MRLFWQKLGKRTDNRHNNGTLFLFLRSMDFFPTPNLPLVAVLIGALLVGIHLYGLMAADFCMLGARNFPRSRVWGTVLISISALWLLALVATTDLGEFSSMRSRIMIALVVGAVLLWKFVPDFLSSRSLGFLLLLAAHPVLETTFLQSGMLHFALATLAYGWALAGLFLVGMPYLHRDLIGWICATKWRWNLACWAGLLYGLLLLTDGTRLEILN